jgi:hypothetical protein
MLMFYIIKSQIPHLNRGYVMGREFLKTNDERNFLKKELWLATFFFTLNQIL